MRTITVVQLWMRDEIATKADWAVSKMVTGLWGRAGLAGIRPETLIWTVGRGEASERMVRGRKR